MKVSLEGKHIFVLGATGAIGRAILESAQECGAWVGGSYFRNEEGAAQLKAHGIFIEQADLADRRQARAAVAHAIQAAGQLDALVYAAGNVRDHLLVNMQDDEWDQVLALHLDGLMACCQEVLPHMQGRRSGKLVAITSFAGLTGRVGQANYSAAKAATIGFMKTVAREAGRFGVTANIVSPGFIESGMTRAVPQEGWERAKAASALGTISSVKVVASFTTWLLSDLCHGVTGQLFCLDSRVL